MSFTSYFTQRMPRRAFTLIELLVVITIISLLAAILFPVFARARENARRASCQSNEKQLALGMRQYSQDYDERLPVYSTTTYWFVLIQPYVKSYQIVHCPDMPGKYYPDGDVGQSDYAMMGKNSSLYTYAGRHLATIADPARSWLVVESQNQSASATYAADGYPFVNPTAYTDPAVKPPTYGRNSFAFRHFDGQNVAFVDGHVKWILDTNSMNWVWNP